MNPSSTSNARTIEKIYRDLGSDYREALLDENTVEFGVNPDQSVWLERAGDSPIKIGTIKSSITRSLISQVAGFHGLLSDARHPIIEAQFPGDDSRFTGILPPLVSGPSIRIRKHTVRDIRLSDYVQGGSIDEEQCKFIISSLRERKNVLVAGGTSSGKTTFANALLQEICDIHPNHSVVIIEDTPELKCRSKNHTKMQTSNFHTMEDLVRVSLRWSPDRIILGELRGPEALHLADAWNSGHPGGICTIHANSAHDAMTKLESLITRHPRHPKDVKSLAESAINLIVYLEKTDQGRRIREIARVQAPNNKKRYEIEPIL